MVWLGVTSRQTQEAAPIKHLSYFQSRLWTSEFIGGLLEKVTPRARGDIYRTLGIFQRPTKMLIGFLSLLAPLI